MVAAAREVDSGDEALPDPKLIEDVLTVVETRRALKRSRTTTDLLTDLKQGDLIALINGANGGGTARPTGTNDGGMSGVSGHATQPKACVFQASQSLRKGVRLVRRSRTVKPSRSISRNKLR